MVGELLIVFGKADIGVECGVPIALVFVFAGFVGNIATGYTINCALDLGIRVQIETPGGVGNPAPIACDHSELFGFAFGADVDNGMVRIFPVLAPRNVTMTIVRARSVLVFRAPLRIGELPEDIV